MELNLACRVCIVLLGSPKILQKCRVSADAILGSRFRSLANLALGLDSCKLLRVVAVQSPRRTATASRALGQRAGQVRTLRLLGCSLEC